jgi:hypothetical protein
MVRARWSRLFTSQLAEARHSATKVFSASLRVWPATLAW